jgi:hypothetical protein
MAGKPTEQMPYRGESPQDRLAFSRYLEKVKRGKSLLALVAMRDALTPAIRRAWHSGSFTAIETSEGRFDELTCNLVYHFGKHGENYASIAQMTLDGETLFRCSPIAGEAG